MRVVLNVVHVCILAPNSGKKNSNNNSVDIASVDRVME